MRQRFVRHRMCSGKAVGGRQAPKPVAEERPAGFAGGRRKGGGAPLRVSYLGRVLGCPAGFTLIELLVVMVILGLLAALVAPRLFGRVGQSKLGAAQAQIELFGTALDSFRLDVGRYPTTAEGLAALLERPSGVETWQGPYLRKAIPLDPWGRPYVYKAPGEHGEYDLVSYGADGQPGGEGEEQDVVSWKGLTSVQ